MNNHHIPNKIKARIRLNQDTGVHVNALIVSAVLP